LIEEARGAPEEFQVPPCLADQTAGVREIAHVLRLPEESQGRELEVPDPALELREADLEALLLDRPTDPLAQMRVAVAADRGLRERTARRVRAPGGRSASTSGPIEA